MAEQRPWDTRKAMLNLGLAAGAGWLLQRSGPLTWANGDINLVSSAAAVVFAICGTKVISDAFWLLAKHFEYRESRIAPGHKGTAGWIRSLSEFGDDLIKTGWGPYWGSLKKGRDVIFSGFASNALCLGPSGSSKDTSNLGPNLLAIRESKTILCLKGDTPVIYADALRKRGEIVHVVNIGDVFSDKIGPSAHVNPLDSVADCFFQPGGLADVTSEIEEKCNQLYPPTSEEAENKNRFFDNGSVALIGFCILICVLVKGYKATLGDTLQMLNDRQSLLRHALWAAGRLEQEDGSQAQIPLHDSPWAHLQDAADIETFIEYLAALAAGIVDQFQSDDTRSIDSFLTGAKDQLSSLNITTRAHKIMQESTFRFAEQKDEGKIVTVFLVADSSRLESQKKALEIIQHTMLNAWKRHPNKSKPVYLFANEITNLRLVGLDSLLTWGRAYSIRILLYIQSLSAFRKAYGTEALNTLLSETEIKQILPGQREPETLKLIEDMLGQYSYMGHNYQSEKRGPLGLKGSGWSEDSAALLTADQIRRLKRTILIIRKNRPALVRTPSVAAIAPWRGQQAISPFYNKPYRLPVELRIWRRSWTCIGLLKRGAEGLFNRLAFWRARP